MVGDATPHREDAAFIFAYESSSGVGTPGSQRVKPLRQRRDKLHAVRGGHRLKNPGHIREHNAARKCSIAADDLGLRHRDHPCASPVAPAAHFSDGLAANHTCIASASPILPTDPRRLTANLGAMGRTFVDVDGLTTLRERLPFGSPDERGRWRTRTSESRMRYQS